jgi:hypothetical protein
MERNAWTMPDRLKHLDSGSKQYEPSHDWYDWLTWAQKEEEAVD